MIKTAEQKALSRLDCQPLFGKGAHAPALLEGKRDETGLDSTGYGTWPKILKEIQNSERSFVFHGNRMLRYWRFMLKSTVTVTVLLLLL